MAGKAAAIDPGSHTWKALALKSGKGGIALTRFAVAPAADAAATLAQAGFPLQNVVVGLAGRDMTLRYTQVPPSPDWQLKNLMELEIQDLASQSGGALSADYNLLPGADDADVDIVLLALARNEALEGVSEEVKGARGSVAAHVPNCVALYNAYVRTAPIEDEDQVVCLAHIGHDTTDIALVRGADLLFARNLSSGTKVLDEAIAQAFNVSARKAEQLKRDLLDLDPASRGRYASGQAEKVTLAAGGASSVFVSAIQSSLAFCQSQTKVSGLRLDRVLLSGGGAKLRGIKGMLREALRCPVEAFDPFGSLDLSPLPAEDAELLREYRAEAVVAFGLAVGRVEDDAYELEILPEHVKRRQQFTQRTVWNIAAGVVAGGLLLFGALEAQDEVAQAESNLQTVTMQKRRFESVDQDATELAQKVQADREAVNALAARAIPLDGVLRAMRAIQDGLPPELWITGIEVQHGRRGSSRGASEVDHPLIVVEGAGRPIHGRDVGEIYRDWSLKFKNHELMQGADVVPKSDPTTNTFSLTIDFMPTPPEKPANPEKPK